MPLEHSPPDKGKGRGKDDPKQERGTGKGDEKEKVASSELPTMEEAIDNFVKGLTEWADETEAAEQQEAVEGAAAAPARTDSQDTFLLNPEGTLDPTQETIILEETSKDLHQGQARQFRGLPPGDRSSSSSGSEWTTSRSEDPKKGKPKEKKKKKKNKKSKSDGGAKTPKGKGKKGGGSDGNTRLTRSQANKKGIKLDKDGKPVEEPSQATSTPIPDNKREAFNKFDSECLRAARESKKAERVSAGKKPVSDSLRSLSRVSMDLRAAFEEVTKRVIFDDERKALKGRFDLEMIAIHQQMRRLEGFVEQFKIESAPSVASTPEDIRPLIPERPTKLDLGAIRKPPPSNPTKSTEYRPVDILKEKLEKEAAETKKKEKAALAASKQRQRERQKKDSADANRNRPQVSNETFNHDENNEVPTTDSQQLSSQSGGSGRGRGRSNSSGRGRGQTDRKSVV